MSFQQRGNGNKLTMAFSLFTFWRDQRKFLPFFVQFFSKTPFSKTAHLIWAFAVLNIHENARTKVPFERSTNCPLPTICAQNKLLAPKHKKPPKKSGIFV